MEKFSLNTRFTINELTIQYIDQPEDNLLKNVESFMPVCNDELIGIHLLTPHLNQHMDDFDFQICPEELTELLSMDIFFDEK